MGGSNYGGSPGRKVGFFGASQSSSPMRGGSPSKMGKDMDAMTDA